MAGLFFVSSFGDIRSTGLKMPERDSDAPQLGTDPRWCLESRRHTWRGLMGETSTMGDFHTPHACAS